MTLYESLLGKHWNELAPSIQEFLRKHNSTYTATLDIGNGDWWLSRAVARLLRLPRAGLKVPLMLRRSIVSQGADRQGADRIGADRLGTERERWERKFPDMTLDSLQWSENGLFVEQFGPVVCSFQLRIADGVLMFQQQSTEVMLFGTRCRLPKLIAPLITGYCEPGQVTSSTFVHVSVWLPVARVILTYAGQLQPS